MATICNTVAAASPFALWLTDGAQQYVVDLSDYLQDSGGLTGVAYHDQKIFLAVQSGRPRILVLDLGLNVVDVIQHQSFNDLHSLHVAGNSLFIVSTRNGQLLRRDLAGGEIAVVAEFDAAAWVSGVHCRPDDIWLCCHEIRQLDPQAQGGGVFSVGRGRKMVDGLLRPHSLIQYGNQFVVLDSGHASVVYFDQDGIGQTCVLQGFPRGVAVSGEATLLVAGGPHRTISRKNPVGPADKSLRDVADERLKLFEVVQGRHTRTFLPELPGFEIYDLFLLPEGTALCPADDRMIRVEPGMFARLYYVTLVDALVRLRNAAASS